MQSTLEAARTCPDCPVVRLGRLAALVGGRVCAFEPASLDARDDVPKSWAERYGIGVVRAGVLIRERGIGGDVARPTGPLAVSSQFGARRGVAVDAAGPEAMFPLERERERGASSGAAGYAATDLDVCLLPREVVERAMTVDVGRDLVALQHAMLRRIELLARARGGHSVRARVASLLVSLGEWLSPRMRDRLPAGLQQRDLARLVSVRHETFCRALGELERAGMVRRDPEGLVILDRARLEAIEGE